MLAITNEEFNIYGCPNCGCDYAVSDRCYRGDQVSVNCKHCGLHFMIVADINTDITTSYSTGRYNEDGSSIMESPVLIKHPRITVGTKWKWEPKDERPEDGGEYWVSRGVGYDLAGFVKTKKAGERILDMVREVLDKPVPASWLDYRPSEPTWIQFKFQESEFDLDKLHSMTKDKGIVTKEILMECRINK